MVCLGDLADELGTTVESGRVALIADGPLGYPSLEAGLTVGGLTPPTMSRVSRATMLGVKSNSPQTNASTTRATSRSLTLCLGGMTDALRDNEVKRIAGWVSDYRTENRL